MNIQATPHDNNLIILHIKYTIEKSMTASYLVQ